ncbi:MAG TPA: efflux RND transporter permease subunit, partial [Gemmatimonadaceae bacterium]|nr:efflux RND transporter permease subunit [Gemmatimonadaceae bacterium]
LVVVLLSVGGVWLARSLPSAIYPELLFPRITIVAEGSSLGARQVEFSVTRPLEEAVSTVPGVTRVTSKSIRGATEISVTFTPATDMQSALQLAQTRVSQIRNTLPSDVNVEDARLTPSLFPILSYNLEGTDPSTLYDIARYQIRPIISRVPGVGRVDVQGSSIREIEVVADPSTLAAQGLTYNDLATAIQNAISPAAVGRAARDYKQYLIVTDQEAHSVADVGAVVLPNGLHVRDVAAVQMGTEDQVMLVRGDGRPAALLNITRQPGGNTVDIADSVASIAATIRKTRPAGVILKPVYDQAALVREAVTSVRDAMLIGAVLAIIVLFAFLRHGRITAVSATAIPLTMAITVFVMSMIGQTFNLMTLGAMAIAVRLVIDDAVVITENIARHLSFTPDRHLAIRDALQELILPVTTSTITTVVVFLPLGLLTGVVGQFFKALSITLTIAVIVSLFLAITLIPLLSEQFVRASDASVEQPGVKKSGILHHIGRGLDSLADIYERSLVSVLRHVWIMIGGAVLLVILGVVAARFTGTGFLPEMDEGAFVLDYFTPGGTALSETDREVHIAEKILAQTPEISGTSRRTGAELGLFATQQNVGDLVARLVPESKRSRSIFEVMDDVRGKISTAVPRLHIEFVQILSDVINDLAGAARPVEIKLFGDDLNQLETYARSISDPLGKVPGVEDLFNGVSEPSAEILLHVGSAESARAGLTPTGVGDVVQGALLGVPAGEVRAADRAIGVRVRAPDAVRFDANKLGDLPLVSTATRSAVPLSAVATLTPTETRAELDRENQQQMIAVTSDVSGRALSGVMTDVKRVLAAHPPPPGIRVELGGQYAGQQEAFHALLLVLLLAALSVTAVMVVQFQSFVEPLVVLVVAPISFVGAVALLLITGTQLNVSSFMGLILLVGLIVKNGIILLDFTRYRMVHDDVPLEIGLRDAARTRLRPILMTTLCTLFGLLPLALGLGAGSELQRPLALAVIGGLALSTPITLYMVPSLLVLIRGRDYRIARTATETSLGEATATAP